MWSKIAFWLGFLRSSGHSVERCPITTDGPPAYRKVQMVRSLPLERLATDSEGTRESELVLCARKGDGQAFSELVAPYLGLMYRIAARASGNAALAEDAVQ